MTEASTLSTRISSVPAVDSQEAAEGNATTSQFRSPLLRQMMGNKLVTGGSSRPVSATNDVNVLATSDTVTSVETAVNSEPQSIAAEPSAGTNIACIEDEAAICDDPLDPSPRIDEPATTSTNPDGDIAPAEATTTKLIPIEVWTEDSVADASSKDPSDQDDKDEICVADEPLESSPRSETDISTSSKQECLGGDLKSDPHSSKSNDNSVDDKDELCVELLPLAPSPHSEMDISTSDKREEQISISKLHPLSSVSGGSGFDDKDEVCVEDFPLEPSPRSETDLVHGSGKVEERTSSVDEDRDVDTTEISGSAVNVDVLADASNWNGVEDATSPSSALVNGYPDDETRL